MNLAFTMAPGYGDTDLLLARYAEFLERNQLRVVGLVQINTERADGGPCDMDVRVLPDGPVIRISQSLGLGSKGCRLDPNALETAVGFVSAELKKGADILIINKFGKHEAEGRGFRDVIATALENGIPVLVGLNTLNQQAFFAFSEGFAQKLDPDIKALKLWFKAPDSQAAGSYLLP